MYPRFGRMEKLFIIKDSSSYFFLNIGISELTEPVLKH